MHRSYQSSKPTHPRGRREPGESHNAYGSMPHRLIEVALQHFFIPEHIQGIVRSYFSGRRFRYLMAKTQERNCHWLHHIRHLVCHGYESSRLHRGKPEDGDRDLPTFQPRVHGFLTVTTTTHVQARWVFAAVDEVVT